MRAVASALGLGGFESSRVIAERRKIATCAYEFIASAKQIGGLVG